MCLFKLQISQLLAKIFEGFVETGGPSPLILTPSRLNPGSILLPQIWSGDKLGLGFFAFYPKTHI